MVRPAESADYGFVKDLWLKCFDDDKEFVDWNFRCNYSSANTFIADFNNTPSSAMQLQPYTLRLFDKDICCRYVSGVSTLPKFRGKGLVRSLFTYALPYMYKTGCVLSVLFPEVKGMYEKFGYRIIGERTEYISDDFGLGVNQISDELFERLDKIYVREMSNKNLYVSRGRFDWERILTDLTVISKGRAVFDKNGYKLVYPNPKKAHNYIIEEICGADPKGLALKPALPLMLRITNLYEFMKICAPHLPFNKTYTVVDGFIPQNNVSLHVLNGTVTYADETGIKTDIGELCAEIFKYIPDKFINLLF